MLDDPKRAFVAGIAHAHPDGCVQLDGLLQTLQAQAGECGVPEAALQAAISAKEAGAVDLAAAKESLAQRLELFRNLLEYLALPPESVALNQVRLPRTVCFAAHPLHS